MKYKSVIYVALPVVALSLYLGFGGIAQAGFGGGFRGATPEQIVTSHQAMFQQQADLLGMSVVDVKEAWAQGKTIPELIKEKGITAEQLQAKMKEVKLAQMKTQIQTLVDKGVITQSQADKRLQIMQKQIDSTKFNGKKGKGMMKMMGGRGHGGMMGWGW